MGFNSANYDIGRAFNGERLEEKERKLYHPGKMTWPMDQTTAGWNFANQWNSMGTWVALRT